MAESAKSVDVIGSRVRSKISALEGMIFRAVFLGEAAMLRREQDSHGYGYFQEADPSWTRPVTESGQCCQQLARIVSSRVPLLDPKLPVVFRSTKRPFQVFSRALGSSVMES